MSRSTVTMDFFGQQERTRRRTLLLCVLLALAVFVIVVVAYPVFAFIVVWMGPHGGSFDRTPDGAKMWEMMWQWEMVLGVGLGVLALMMGAAGYKIHQLARSGGAGVAQMLGGRPISPDTSDPDERKLLNVVEEMAIASGTTVPPVYILDEESAINAFAAGFTPENAVIGVTRGATVRLTRDELQGVVAHEFSHILNGDMRLNVRMIGVVHGLMFIALIGYGLLASGSRRRYSRSGGKDRGGAALIGLALVVIGMVGVFFGRVIKSAVSRQREYLADAAAVQFTRNPQGLADALKKIGARHGGARLRAERAEEASHMFFGRGVRGIGLLDSHPPLKHRIRRIDPSWDGKFPVLKATIKREYVAEGGDNAAEGAADGRGDVRSIKGEGFADVVITGAVAAGAAGTLSQRVVAARAAAEQQHIHSGELTRNALEQVGEPTAAHLEYARKLREAIPDELIAAAQKAGGGRAVIYALLLHGDAQVREAQLQRLAEHAEPAAYEMVKRIAPIIDELGDEVRLILIDLALPALRRLTREQYAAFGENMHHLIRADKRVSLFEWMMRRVVLHDLEPHVTGAVRPPTLYYSLRTLGEPIAGVLSIIAYLGAADEAEARRMYAVGVSLLDIDPPVMWDKSRCGLEAMNESLDTLAQTSLRHKRTLLTAFAACIAANKRVTTREAELLRAISNSFDVPMPPLLPGQPLT